MPISEDAVSGGRLVDFCVIGTQKSGTSALFEFLSYHPNVAMSNKKEVHFFDSDQHFAGGNPDYAKYHRFFSRTDGRSIMGEATPIYIFWPNTIERLAAYNPKLRVIAIFRDPVERAYAHWRMIRSRGLEALDFSQAIRRGRNRLYFPTEFALRNWSYVERGFYGAQVSRLFCFFPRDQILLLRSNDLRDDHDGTLRALFKFLGISFVKVPKKLIFASEPPTSRDMITNDDVEYLRDLYRDDLLQFINITNLDVFRWITPPK